MSVTSVMFTSNGSRKFDSQTVGYHYRCTYIFRKKTPDQEVYTTFMTKF